MRLVVILPLLCLPMTAADMTVKEYQKEIHSSDRLKSDAVRLHVMGIGQGIAWASTAAAKAGSPLYCQPPTFSMNGNNYIDILDKIIKAFESKTTAKELNEFPIGMLLLMGLQQSFPCEAAK